jgi:hypothetical protein
MDIHVVPGASEAATVELALGLGSDGVVALVDPLSVGPLTAFGSLEGWANSRLGFLACRTDVSSW